MGFVDGVADEAFEDEGIVLEEVAGEEAEGEWADGFFGFGAGVGEDLAIGLAEEERGTAFPCGFMGRAAGGGQGVVDGLGGDGAGGNVDEFLATAVAEEADGSDGSVFGDVEVRGDFGAIVVFAGRGGDWFDGEVDPGHVAEEFLDLLTFPDELFGVGEVLVLAAAAVGEERALRGDAVRGWDEDCDEIGLAEVFVVAVDPGADGFAGEGEGDEDDPAVDAAEALAHVRQGGDFEVDFLMIGERVRIEFPRRAGGRVHARGDVSFCRALTNWLTVAQRETTAMRAKRVAWYQK